MENTILINWRALIVATVAPFIVGGLWYGTLFGDTFYRLVHFMLAGAIIGGWR